MKILTRTLLLLFSVFAIACSSDETDTSGENGSATENGTESTGTASNGSSNDMFTSDEGGFSVFLPGGENPAKQTTPVPTEVGNIDMHMYLVEDDDFAYMIAYSDYPEMIIKAADPQTLLNGGRDGAIRNINGELEKESDIEYSGNPGKEFYAKGMSQGQTIFARANIYMVGNRLYQLLFMSTTSEGRDADDVNKYFSSFALTNPDMGKAEDEPAKEEKEEAEAEVH